MNFNCNNNYSNNSNNSNNNKNFDSILKKLTTFVLDSNNTNYEYIKNKINKNIKNTDNVSGIILPKKLSENSFIILLKDKFNGDIISFIWYGFYVNNKLEQVLHINFSYTFITFRNNGYNKYLRIELENICKIKNINLITSVPFENSPSKKILIKLNYVDSINYFYKKID